MPEPSAWALERAAAERRVIEAALTWSGTRTGEHVGRYAARHLSASDELQAATLALAALNTPGREERYSVDTP